MNDKQTILIVDDLPDNLDLLRALFGNKYQIQVANNGELALKIAQSQRPPELILLDISMPGMDGYEVCERLQANKSTRAIPIIFVTANNEARHEAKGFELGAVDFIIKPFNLSIVKARVKTHLELSSARKAVEKKNQELKELNATKDKFFSIIAHDLKGPFNGLIGLTSLMEKPGAMAKTDMHEMCTLVKNASLNLFNLLEDLLTWARIQMGKMEFKPKELNFSRVVTKTIDLLSLIAENKGVPLLVEGEKDLSFFADEQMVNAILRNLISNAIKFTNKGGTVKISAHSLGENILIAVEDEGIGIGEKALEKIFRIDQSHSTVGTEGEKGTGLGLILCKDLVEQNGGKIHAQSKQGKGSTFSVTLPMTNIHSHRRL